jgi:hypothetical protein
MRDQWVANLKKKRTGGPGSSSNGTCSPPSDAAAAKHATIGKTKTTSAAISINASIPAEKDSMVRSSSHFS